MGVAIAVDLGLAVAAVVGVDVGLAANAGV